MPDNDELYKNAEEAITVLFGDTSVSKRKCASNLESLKATIEDMIDSLGLDNEDEQENDDE